MKGNSILTEFEPYRTSKVFAEYQALVTDCSNMNEASPNWSFINAQRELATNNLARRPATRLGDIFEKLCVWKAETLTPSPSGFIYCDDWFPLSAWFDLATILGAELNSCGLTAVSKEQLMQSISLTETL